MYWSLHDYIFYIIRRHTLVRGEVYLLIGTHTPCFHAILSGEGTIVFEKFHKQYLF